MMLKKIRDMDSRRIRLIITTALALILTSLVTASERAATDWFKEIKGGSMVQEGASLFMRLILVKVHVWGGFIPKYAQSFPTSFYEAVLANPSVYDPGIFNIMTLFIRILEPIYVVMIMAVGFYLFFVTTSPSSRSKAKRLLTYLVITMVLTSLSLPLVDLLLNFTAEATKAVFGLISNKEIGLVLGGGVDNVFWAYALTAVAHTDLGLPYLMVIFAMAFIPYMIIGLRYIMVCLFAALFPLSLLLYVVPWLRGVGRKMIEQLIAWAVLQIFIAIIIVVFVGIGITIEDHFVVNAEIALTKLRAMYNIIGAIGAGGVGAGIGAWGGWWGALIGGAAGGVAGFVGLQAGMGEFFEAMPATISIVNFVLSVAIYAMLIIFPLIWIHHLHDFIP